MPVHIALLRGINVGGRNLVSMSELRDLLATLGFTGARSLLQSGNLVFPSDRLTGAALERLLEAETSKRMNVSIDYLVRTQNEWQAIIDRNPFADAALRDPSHLLIMCLRTAPQHSDVQALQAAIKGPEVLSAIGKQLYIIYPAGIGPSKLTHTLMKRSSAHAAPVATGIRSSSLALLRKNETREDRDVHNA
jgi:uncharacterized protein (DUF1697 family)